MFSLRAIGIGAFLGGPLAPGVLAAINFYRLGRTRAGHGALLIGVAASVVLFGGLILLPSDISDRIPNALLPAIYVPLAVYWVRRTQGNQVKALYDAGAARKASGWLTAGLSLGALALCLGVIFPVAMAMPPFGFKGTPTHFGPDGMHTVYVHGHVEPAAVEDLFDTLNERGWVADEFGMTFQIRHSDEGYELTIPILREWWDDADFLADAAALRAELTEKTFEAPVIVIVIDEDLKQTYRKKL